MNDDAQAHALYRQMQIEVVYRLQVALAIYAAYLVQDRNALVSGLHYGVMECLNRDLERELPTARRH